MLGFYSVHMPIMDLMVLTGGIGGYEIHLCGLICICNKKAADVLREFFAITTMRHFCDTLQY